MAIEAAPDLFAALAREDFGAIIGTAESQWLDFKSEPYHFPRNDQRLAGGLTPPGLNRKLRARGNKPGGKKR